MPEHTQKANNIRQVVVPTRYSVVKAAVRLLKAERAIGGNQNIECATTAAKRGRENNTTVRKNDRVSPVTLISPEPVVSGRGRLELTGSRMRIVPHVVDQGQKPGSRRGSCTHVPPSSWQLSLGGGCIRGL